MKKQKTLHRFAAVAAVLLALCLVFMMPAAAEGGTECTGCNTNTVHTHVAQVGEGESAKYYATLQAAVNVAGAEDTIVLINDVTLTGTLTISADEEITLDLNGKTISQEKYCTASYQMIGNNGKLTIIDSEDGGTISFTDTGEGDPTFGWGSYTIRNDGTLVVGEEGGNADFTIEHIGTQTSGTHCTMAIFQYSGSTTIHGGSICNENYRSMRLWKGDMTINGGTFEGQIWVQNNGNIGPGNLIINDGTFSPRGNDGSCVFITNSGSTQTTLSITDGTFTTKVGASDFSKLGRCISGGTFANDVSAYVADGYYAQQNEDGTYTVKNTCDVTFDSDGGSEVGDMQASYKGTITEPTAPTREGYDFAGWYTDAELTTVYNFETPVTSDITLYAKWDAISYTITVTDGSASSTTATIGTEITLTPNTKDGFTFKEWNVASGDIIIKGYTFAMPASAVEVFAVYDKELDAGEEIAPEISVSVEVTYGKTTIKSDASSDTKTTVGLKGDDKQTVVITDANTGVQINVKFDDEPEVNVNERTYTGEIDSLSVIYPEAPAEVEGSKEIKQTILFDLTEEVSPENLGAIELPSIDSEKKPDVVDKVKKQEQRANVLAMITATNDNIDTINEYIGTVTITFKVHADLISNSEFLKAYHVKGNNVDVLSEDKLEITGPENGFYTITITSDDKFSSYVLVEEEPKQTSSSGSAVDTGSGNYQYYPRSVPTDGIVDFGTSKVVTGMEPPAGSDGTVTLNIKPTFAMPENGFYAFEIDAPGYNTDAKINGGLSFQIPVADLEAAGWTAEDIVLFHGTVGEDGKITWEALPTNLVKNENGVAYYKAAINSCSPFYIGFVKDGSVVNTEVVDPVTPETPETPVTPDEPEVLPPVDEPETPEQPTESPAPILAVLAGLGAAVVLRRK